MVNYFIYAKDFSLSTRKVNYYHNNGLKSLDQFKRHVDSITKELSNAGESTESKIIYLHWGTRCFEVDEERTVEAYKQMEGNMGTAPITIVEWIKQNQDICDENNTIKLLYIITDGEIDSSGVTNCIELNKDVHYETVVFHAFNENLSQIDLSVAASFFKKHCVVYRNYEVMSDIDITEEFDYDKINVDNFVSEKEHLKSYIQLKFITKFRHDIQTLQEIDKLKKLRNRLLADLSLRTVTEINLETKDRNVFLSEFVHTDWYKNLVTPDHDLKVLVEQTVSNYINYIMSEKASYSFDALKFNKTFSKPVEEEPIADVNFTAEQEIEFPDIILDDEKGIPVIILAELNLLNKIIFNTTKESNEVSSASFNKFTSAMQCPLFLLNDSDVSESIGYFYTLNVYKQLLEKTTKTEPRTRRPFHGGLVLTDTDEFDKYNDYVLSATYFNFKKVFYNVGLFYFVLWKNCENKEWMDRNVVEQFKKYVMRRISGTVCKIGLSSLPLDPTEKTSLPTALWYCLEVSSRIFKDDAQNFMHERLRMYFGVAQYMIEILKYLNYDLDLDFIEKRLDVIRHVNILKKIPTQVHKAYYLLERIFKTVDGFLVYIIENPENLHKLNYLKLNHKGMLTDNVINEKVDLNDYVHIMYHIGDVENTKANTHTFEICDKTFRPFFTIDQNKSFYTELAKATKKVVINDNGDKHNIEITFEAIDALQFDKILSLYNLFINCVKDLEKYPTLAEYVEYVIKKKQFHGNLVTIFQPNTYLCAEYIYARYQNVISKFDVKEFIKVSKAYVNRSERIKAEEVIKFNNDIEINEFISSEEAKVNMKKTIKKYCT